MSIISIILVLIIAFFAGLEGILDEFQFHQPIISCTLIGLVTGHLTAGIILGGTIQMMALGWANIGAAVAPDAALAGVAAAIIMVQSGNFDTKGITVAFSTAIPLSVAGLFLTMFVRTISVGLVHVLMLKLKKVTLRVLNVSISSHFYYKVFVSLSLLWPLSWYQLKPYKMRLKQCQLG